MKNEMNLCPTHASALQTGRVALIQSSWHREIVGACTTSFVSKMIANGISEPLIDVIEVLGAFEIPLHAKLCLRTGRYSAIVAAALVIDGGIYRHEFVAQTVINALMLVQLESTVPVFSAVLTPHHFHETSEHRDFFRAHLAIKGEEVGKACIDTLRSVARLINQESQREELV